MWRLGKSEGISPYCQKGKERKYYFFFVWIQRGKDHTRSVVLEKTRKGERLFFLSFFSLMKRSKNHPTT
jgi:hypothetical protein